MELPGTKKNQSNVYYWQIIQGLFARRVKEGEGKMRTTKTNKIVYEDYVDSITGTLAGVHVHNGEYGETLVVTLIPAPGFKYQINIQKDSRFGTTFLERLPKLKVGDVIELKPYAFEDDKEKKVSGMNVFKGDKKVESAFKAKADGKWITKDGYPEFPNDWNSLTEKKKKYYFIEVDDFLTTKLNEWIAANGHISNSETDTEEQQLPEIDDEPF